LRAKDHNNIIISTIIIIYIMSQQQATPLPSGQVIIVICVQTCESMNINVLFPFLAFMVEDFGYTGHQIGYYAGVLAASFCAAQLTSSYLWGWLSDNYGRKPALFFGTFGTGFGMLMFGLAPTFEVAVLGRFASGILSGNLGVLKSFLSEITDGTNRGKGFSYLNVAWSVGSILGPLLGGFLCYPVQKYPHIFEEMHMLQSLFLARPFLLPCLVCVSGNLFTSVCIALCMVETRQGGRGVGSGSQGYSHVDTEEEGEEEGGSGGVELTALMETASSTPMTKDSNNTIIQKQNQDKEEPISSFYDSTVIVSVALYGLLAFGDIIGNETLPLFCKLDNDEGGLSLNSSEIGFALSFGGFAGLVFSLFALPHMIGDGKSKLSVFRKYTLVNVVLIMVFPLLGYVLKFLLHSETTTSLNDEQTSHQVVIGLLVMTHVCRYMASILSFTVVIIFVNHSVTDAHLGKVNGLGQMAAATARSVGPAFGGVLWSQSLKFHFIFSNFILVSVIMLLCFYLSLRLPVSIEDKKDEE
jgi:MFS family permease